VFDYQWGATHNNIYHGKVEGIDVYFLECENGFFECVH
jgi:hypothetical protein